MKTIKQAVTFKASAHDVYEALMDAEKHARFTGDRASISRKVGGAFTAYGDYIEGKNIELVPDQKIVQSWRASDWPEGHYSRVTYSLKEKDGVTSLTFTQTDIPDEAADDVAQGWRDYYWKPMKKMLQSK
jgi:activator of HSP90 ATPase